MSGLVAENVVVTIEDRRLLDDVSFGVRPGEMVAVLGPNGAGKSTLLRALTGLTALTAGRVTLDDRDLKTWSPRALASARAYLPQNPTLEWPLTVARVVALGRLPLAGLWGEASAAIDDAVDRALAELDSLGLRERIATTLSGGELARVLLARAIVAAPRLVLADEPLAGLDPRHQLDALQRLRKMADDGRAVVLALHDLDLAARFATRVVLLSEGRVLVDGPPAKTLTPERIAAAFAVTARIGADEHGPWVRLVR